MLRKLSLILLSTIIVFALCTCGTASNSEQASESSTTSSKVSDGSGNTGWLESYFEQEVGNYGTLKHLDTLEKPDGGKGNVMILQCSFDKEDKAGIVKQQIMQFSEGLASRVNREQEDVEEEEEVKELIIVWDVPSLDGTATIQFDREGNEMKSSHKMFSF